MERATPGVRREELTDRQREVLQLIALGRTNAEIAEELGISLDGAKYHVREILGRLGVESREDAAEWWRSNGRKSPFGAFRRLLALPAWQWLGAATAVAAVAFGAFAVFAAMRSDDSHAVAPAPSATAEPTTAAPTPTADVSLAPRDPAWVLANGTPVDFDVCETITGWRHPTLDEVLGAPGSYLRVRWGATTNHDLAPADYGLFLSHFLYEAIPMANSGNIEPSNLMGLGANVPGVSTAARSCPPPGHGRFGFSEQDVWLADYRVVSMRRNGRQLAVAVEAAPGTFEIVSFDSAVSAPTTPPTNAGPDSYTTFDILSASGVLLYDGPGFGGNAQYDDRGALEFAIVRSTDATVVRIAGTTTFSLFAGFDGATNIAASSLSVRVVASGTASRVPLSARAGQWDPIALVTLQAGEYELSVQGATTEFLLLPANAPLP